MNYIVIPLSRIPASPFSLPLFLNGLIGHALLVGLPIAYAARHYLGWTKAVAADAAEMIAWRHEESGVTANGGLLFGARARAVAPHEEPGSLARRRCTMW